MKKYTVTYRDEIFCDVEAENEEEAIKISEKSKNWEFILEGHPEMFNAEETD